MRFLVPWVLVLAAGCSGDPVDAAPKPPGSGKGSASGGGGQGSATDGSGSGTGTGTGTDTSFECGELELPIKVNPPNVVLTLDRSGSMGFPWDHDNNPVTPESTRWESLLLATEILVQEFGADMRMGGAVFPGVGSMEGCDVPAQLDVPIANGGGQAMVTLLGTPGAVPEGGTPTAAALGLAVSALKGEPDNAPRVVVLVTDGLPSCGESIADAIAVADAARTKDGVFTFGIGVGVDPGTVPAFQALAAAGGASEVFFNGTNEDELVEALQAVAGDVVRCRIPLTEIPTEPDDLTIELNGVELEALAECGDVPGWAFLDPGGAMDTIEICSATCDALTEASELVAVYACPPVTPGP